MSQYATYTEFRPGKPENLSLNDHDHEYHNKETGDENCIDWFDDRLEGLVREERFMPSKNAVASTAMRIGICILENSERDAMDLVHQTWLETGKEKKLKEELLENFSTEIQSYNLEENLGELEPSEMLELFRMIRGVRAEPEEREEELN